MKIKTFDCVEMKRRGAARVRDELEGMTVEQQLDYWKRFTDELLERKRSIAERSPGGAGEGKDG